MENRRKERRYRIRRTGMIGDTAGAHAVETIDVSPTGARVALDRPLLEGADVMLSLHLPESPFGERLNADAVVIWCAEGMDVGFEVGLRLNLPDEDKTRLAAFLADFENT